MQSDRELCTKLRTTARHTFFLYADRFKDIHTSLTRTIPFLGVNEHSTLKRPCYTISPIKSSRSKKYLSRTQYKQSSSLSPSWRELKISSTRLDPQRAHSLFFSISLSNVSPGQHPSNARLVFATHRLSTVSRPSVITAISFASLNRDAPAKPSFPATLLACMIQLVIHPSMNSCIGNMDDDLTTGE